MGKLRWNEDILGGWVHPADRAKPEYAERWRAYNERDKSAGAPMSRTTGMGHESDKRVPAPMFQETEPEPVVVPHELVRAPVEISQFEAWLGKSGLTVEQAAERFGCDRRTIHRWKAKGAPPDIMHRLER
jgi:hypothetical protein